MLSLLDKSTRDMLQAFSLCSRGLSKQHVQELSRSENPLVATGGRSRMEAVVSSVNGASAPSSGKVCVASLTGCKCSQGIFWSFDLIDEKSRIRKTKEIRKRFFYNSFEASCSCFLL